MKNRKFLVIGFLFLGFLGTVSAQAPDIDVRPDNLNNSNFNPSNPDEDTILVGKNYSTEVTFENLDNQDKVINFTLPDREYYEWDTDDKVFNISNDSLVRKDLEIDFEGERNISDNLVYEFKYNDSNGDITFNKNEYPEQNVSLESEYANVSLSVNPLSDQFTIPLGESQRRVFEVINNDDDFKAYNIQFSSGEYASDFSEEGFNLSEGGSKVVDYTAGVSKPDDDQEATDKTGQVYTGSISAEADNKGSDSFNFDIDVPEEDFTLPESQEDFDGLFSSFEKFCRENPSECNITETVTETETVVKNQTVPVESNLTEEDIATLKRLAQSQANRNQEIEEEINLVKTLIKNRFQSFENELDSVKEQSKETEAQANRTEELYQELQEERVQQRQSAEQTFVLFFIGLLFTGFFGGGIYLFVKIYRNRKDYRV